MTTNEELLNIIRQIPSDKRESVKNIVYGMALMAASESKRKTANNDDTSKTDKQA